MEDPLVSLQGDFFGLEFSYRLVTGGTSGLSEVGVIHQNLNWRQDRLEKRVTGDKKDCFLLVSNSNDCEEVANSALQH